MQSSRILIARTGEGDPSALARAVRDAGHEVVLLTEVVISVEDLAAVAVQEDVAALVLMTPDGVGAGEEVLVLVRQALALEDAGDVVVVLAATHTTPDAVLAELS